MSDVLCDLHVTHTRRSPVYVIGYPRSGTSLTCRLLRRYLKVSFDTESQFIVRYYRRLQRYGDLSDNQNLRRLVKDISAERFFARSQQNWGFVFDPARALAEVEERSYSGILHAILRQLADHNGMVRWGDKTPEYNEHLPLLRRLFPDAQFIHIVRDGRDVALSIQGLHFGPTNACETASQWVRALHAIQYSARQLPSDQFFEIRYEDLTQRPAETIAALADFLGVDDATGRLRRYVQSRIGDDIKSGNFGKWRQRLSPRDVERFEAIAGRELALFGYELVLGGVARPVTGAERLYWHLHSQTSRLLRVGRWSDNWYKLGLWTRIMSPDVFRRAAALCQAVRGRSTGA